jgi:hypothetical protein
MEHEKKTRNGKIKFSKRAKEMQHGEVARVFPSVQLEERREVDFAVVCCGFCKVTW